MRGTLPIQCERWEAKPLAFGIGSAPNLSISQCGSGASTDNRIDSTPVQQQNANQMADGNHRHRAGAGGRWLAGPPINFVRLSSTNTDGAGLPSGFHMPFPRLLSGAQ